MCIIFAHFHSYFYLENHGVSAEGRKRTHDDLDSNFNFPRSTFRRSLSANDGGIRSPNLELLKTAYVFGITKQATYLAYVTDEVHPLATGGPLKQHTYLAKK